MYKGTKCLVTGGTGMIGRKVCDLLVGQGAEVISISLDDLRLNEHVDYIYGNLADSFFVMDLITSGKYDYVFHCAGVKGNPKVTEEKPASFFVPIVQMNTNVLETCRLTDIKGVVYTSSKAVYDYEKSYAGWAKMTGEKQIEAYRKQYDDKRFHIIRLHNVFGEGDNFDPQSAMVIPSLMAKIARGDNPVEVWGDGSDRRDFIYSGDIAGEILDSMFSQHSYDSQFGEVYSIKSLIWYLHHLAEFTHKFTKEKKIYKIILDPTTNLSDNRFMQGLSKTWVWFLSHREEYKRKQDYFK